MEVKIDNGKVSFNIHDMFSSMSDDELELLALEFAWHLPAWKEIVRTLRTSLATPNYNADLYHVRKMFFMLPYDNEDDDFGNDDFWNDQKNFRIIRIMQETMHQIISENAQLVSEIYKMHLSKSKIYGEIRRIFGEDTAYKVNSILVSSEYGEPTYHELSSMISQGVSSEEFVKLWTEKTQEFFNKKVKETKENE